MEPNPNIWSICSETARIIKCYCRHLLALSFIFLLPLSSLFLLYPNLYFQILNHSQQHQPIKPTTPLFFYQLLYSLCVMFFSFCGVSSITYSVFHGFHGQPFNLLSSIKSIFTSFFPPLATTIVLKVIFFFITLFLGLLSFLIVLGTRLVGITISYSFIGLFFALVMLPFLFVVIYLQVKWTLVPVIVVVEKCWGLEPLRRSASLMHGMKKVGLCLLLFFGFFEGIYVWSSSISRLLILTMGSRGLIPIKFDWVDILLIIVGKSPLLMILLLLNIVVNTMLYISCKGIHREHKEEGGKEYVSVPLDDKVPLVVSGLDV